MSTVIKVENLSKHYNLGNIGSDTLRDELAKLWAKTTGKQYETAKIGENNNSNSYWALKDINFEVQQGEVLGIIGKNGAGKSTLLKILSKITAPTTGKIKVKGRIASLLEVGTGFHPELTGRENIFLNGAILGMTKAEIKNKFDEIVYFSGIEKFIDTPVKRYSSGMYVRLAFAVAAHLEPEILIIDEVLAVGDAEFQKKCLGKMKDVAGQGRTVLFVSHNMQAVHLLCNNSLLLADGYINMHGKTQDVINKYLDGGEQCLDINYTNKYTGDKFVRLLNVRFIQENMKSVDALTVDKKFGIEIQYELTGEGLKPTPTLFIGTNRGDDVLLSLETLTEGIFDKGEYKSIVWIPANLLNNDKYYAVIGFATVNPTIVHLQTNISFEVFDNLNAITRGDYKQLMRGVVRPYLQWETNKKEYTTN